MGLEALPPFPSLKDPKPRSMYDILKENYLCTHKSVEIAEHEQCVYRDSHIHMDRHQRQMAENRRNNRPDRVGFIWSKREEQNLRAAHEASVPIEEMCRLHKRMTNGIVSRLKSLNLL